MNGFTKFLDRVRSEIFYSQKAFFSIVSGFGELQHKVDDGWEAVGSDLFENPFYVCPVFYSGKHLPLPFFTDPDAEIGWLQKKAIELAAKINPGSFKKAKEECDRYDHAWESQTFVDDKPSHLTSVTLTSLSGVQPCPNCGSQMNGNDVVQECPECGYGTEEYDHQDDEPLNTTPSWSTGPGSMEGYEA